MSTGCSDGDTAQQKVTLAALVARIHEQVCTESARIDSLSVFCWVMSLQMYWRNSEWIKAWLEELQMWRWLEVRVEKNRTQWHNAGPLCLLSFLWHWRHCLCVIMKISPLTDWLNKEPSSVRKNQSHRNATLNHTVLIPRQWAWCPGISLLLRPANLH